jgi:hypothetical protein
MENNYKEVPDIITGKDLDYLKDIFSWNYIALKNCSNNMDCVENQDIRKIMQEACDLFDDNLTDVLSILNEHGGQNE